MTTGMTVARVHSRGRHLLAVRRPGRGIRALANRAGALDVSGSDCPEQLQGPLVVLPRRSTWPIRTRLRSGRGDSRESIEALRFSKRSPNRRAVRVYRQAASYHFEHADALRERGATADAAASYRRTAALLERYLDLLGEAAGVRRGASRRERMLSAGAAPTRRWRWGRRSRRGSPSSASRSTRRTTAWPPRPLIQARRFDEAAVTLTVGVMVTGDRSCAPRRWICTVAGWTLRAAPCRSRPERQS